MEKRQTRLESSFIRGGESIDVPLQSLTQHQFALQGGEYESHTRCPYFPSRVHRRILAQPLSTLSRYEYSQCLDKGQRRLTAHIYTKTCPLCNACQPIRIDAKRLKLNRSQRRAWKACEAELRTEKGPLMANTERVDLYHLHREQRGLRKPSDEDITLQRYKELIQTTPVPSYELRYYLGKVLVGVAITDEGSNALSAHYTYFDPGLGLSIGTYSIIKQAQQCVMGNKKWLYLESYVEGAKEMTYKAAFYPHQKMINGQWIDYEKKKK